MANNYTPNIRKSSYEEDDNVMPLNTDSSIKSNKKRMSASVVPGMLISNPKKMGKSNLAQSVGMGLLSGDFGSSL